MIAIAGEKHRTHALKLEFIFFILETVFLMGIIGTFWVFKTSFAPSPPASQPRLPFIETAINTFILILSAFTFQIAFKNLKSLDPKKYIVFLRWLEMTWSLGLIFLVLQGSQWIHLIHFALTPGSGIQKRMGGWLLCLYGLQVLGGLSALTWVKYRANHGHSFHHTLSVELCRNYWFFAAILWPVLYVLYHL